MTNGGFGLFADAVDAMAVQSKSMGLSVANAAKHKASRVLAKRLETEGVYGGEVMVLGTVRGTAWDRGQPRSRRQPSPTGSGNCTNLAKSASFKSVGSAISPRSHSGHIQRAHLRHNSLIRHRGVVPGT